MSAFADGLQSPSPELLLRKPYGRHQPLISQIMMRNILGHSIFQLVILLIFVYAGDTILDIPSGRTTDQSAPPTAHFTFIFNTFVFLTVRSCKIF